MKYFALINNNLVNKVIVADDSFIEEVISQWDIVLDVTDRRPNPGDSYYPDTDEFISNNTDVHYISSDVQIGDFEPFTLSKYSVSKEDDMIKIGCKLYSASGIYDVLHALLIEKVTTTELFTSEETGPTHGKFGITWEDAQTLYDVLCGAKL